MSNNTEPSGIDWIGYIPARWEVKPAKYILESNRKILNETTKADYFFRYIDISSVDFDKGIIGYEEINFENAPSRARRIVKKGDTIISTVRTYLRAIARIEDDKNVIVSTGFAVLSPKNNDPIFIEYYCKSDVFCSEIEKLSYGIAYPAINESVLINIKIILPPPKEQQAIATFLDTQCSRIDGIITEMEQQIEILKQYKTSLITETVTKGLDKSVSMKDSGIDWIGNIPVHWEIKRLKYCLGTPLQYGANETGFEFNEKEPRYIRITDITLDNKLKEGDKLSLPLRIAKLYLLNDGDILFARSGATVGKTFYFDGKYGQAAFAGYMIRATVNRKLLLPEYMYYITLGNSYQNWLNLVYSQATIQNIGANKYENFLTVCPPVKEQKQIVIFLNNRCKRVDNIIQDKRQSIETMRSYKKSLIYEYVTGKKRVKGYQ
jgi:type I restriction enzyme S subunit